MDRAGSKWRIWVNAATVASTFVLYSCDHRLTKADVERQVTEALAQKNDIKMCMTREKIKAVHTSDPTKSGAISQDSFPVIFAEEMFLKWSVADSVIFTVLLGDGYIQVHQGGYEESGTEKGSPGPLYQINSYEDADKAFQDVQRRGALVELTDTGKDAHAWSDDDFCMTGRWLLSSVNDFTEPAPDSTGRIVTHIHAEIKFEPHLIGPTKTKNPFGAIMTRQVEPTSIKYTSGWRVDSVDTE